MRRQPAGTAGGSPAAHRGWHERGYLPHWDVGAVVQAITYRLADSLPKHVELDRRRCQSLLDQGRGSCILLRPDLARVVIESWHHFNGSRYRLHAWVVMPNHVHLVATILDGHPLSRIVPSWKSYTAHRLRVVTGATGRIWHPDYWDRVIRDEAHFVAAVEYVEASPVTAGLVPQPCAWPFSSAAAGQFHHSSSRPKAMR